jgi:hypothetical protein
MSMRYRINRALSLGVSCHCRVPQDFIYKTLSPQAVRSFPDKLCSLAMKQRRSQLAKLNTVSILLLCGLVIRVPGYRTEMYCASCEVRTEFIYVMLKKVDRFCRLVVTVTG